MRLLIIEDKLNQQEFARKALAGKAELDFLGNYEGFLEKIKIMQETYTLCDRNKHPFQYDGVLSDVFFPTDAHHFKDHCVPAGVGVYVICQKFRIPCVMVTAGHHHGKDYQWIGMTLGKLNHAREPWPLIDGDVSGTFGSPDLDREAPEKDWMRGFNQLVKIINNR